MIRFETVGMIEVAKNNPVLTSDSDVTNYSFITVDGDLYLVMMQPYRSMEEISILLS